MAFGVPVIGTTGVLVTVALGVPLTGAFKLTNSSFNALSIALSSASKCELASFALVGLNGFVPSACSMLACI